MELLQNIVKTGLNKLFNCKLLNFKKIKHIDSLNKIYGHNFTYKNIEDVYVIKSYYMFDIFYATIYKNSSLKCNRCNAEVFKFKIHDLRLVDICPDVSEVDKPGIEFGIFRCSRCNLK